MIKKLIYYGNPGLRKKCIESEEIGEDMLKVSQNLVDTVLHLNGAGLAAPQIGEYVRIFVICYDNGADSMERPILCPPKVYINPKLSNPSKKEVTCYREGCLSIPEIYESVKRPYAITVEAIGLDGNTFIESISGWRARSVMHENDHLNGVLFIDRLSPKVRNKIARDLNKIKKQYNNRSSL